MAHEQAESNNEAVASHEPESTSSGTDRHRGLAAELSRKEEAVASLGLFRDEFFSFLSAVAPLKEIDEQLLSRFSNLWIAVDDLALHHELLVQRLADSHRTHASLRQIIWSIDPSRLPVTADEGKLKSSGEVDNPYLLSPKAKKKKKKSHRSKSGQKGLKKLPKDKSKGASTPNLHQNTQKRQHSSSKRYATDSNLYAFSQQTSEVVVDLSLNHEELSASAKEALLELTERIFAKDVTQLPIEKDVPRLIRGVSINGIGFGEWTAALADGSSSNSDSPRPASPTARPDQQEENEEGTTSVLAHEKETGSTTPTKTQAKELLSPSRSLPNVAVLVSQEVGNHDHQKDIGEDAGVSEADPRLFRSSGDDVGDEPQETGDCDSTPEPIRWQRTALSQRPRHAVVRFGSGTSLIRQMVDLSSPTKPLPSSPLLVSSSPDESSSSLDHSFSSRKAVKFDELDQSTTLDLTAASGSDSASSLEECAHDRVESKVDPVFLAQLHGFFIDLCVALGEPPEFCKHVASIDLLDRNAVSLDQGNLDGAVKNYIANVLGPAPLVISVLKLMTQSLVAPAIVALKEGMMLLPFNSIPATWKVDIAVSRNEVSIRHSKSEESAPGAIDRFGSFRFSWFIEFLLDRRSGAITAVNIGMLRFECDLAIDIQHRLSLEQIVRDLVEFGCVKESLSRSKTRINLLVMEKSSSHKSKHKAKGRAVSYAAF